VSRNREKRTSTTDDNDPLLSRSHDVNMYRSRSTSKKDAWSSSRGVMGRKMRAKGHALKKKKRKKKREEGKRTGEKEREDGQGKRVPQRPSSPLLADPRLTHISAEVLGEGQRHSEYVLPQDTARFRPMKPAVLAIVGYERPKEQGCSMAGVPRPLFCGPLFAVEGTQISCRLAVGDHDDATGPRQAPDLREMLVLRP
jgi:hypothetical protein